MSLAHVTKTGNVSIPKEWRVELGIGPESTVMMEKKNNAIIIMPLKKRTLKEEFKLIDEEIKSKNIKFTRAEAIKDDLYD